MLRKPSIKCKSSQCGKEGDEVWVRLRCLLIASSVMSSVWLIIFDEIMNEEEEKWNEERHEEKVESDETDENDLSIAIVTR